MTDDLKKLERETADDLARSFTHNPKAWSWRDGDCDMVNGPSGVTMSCTFMTIYQPVRVKFGFWNRRRIRRAFKRWKRALGDDLANRDHHAALTTLRSCLGPSLRAVA